MKILPRANDPKQNVIVVQNLDFEAKDTLSSNSVIRASLKTATKFATEKMMKIKNTKVICDCEDSNGGMATICSGIMPKMKSPRLKP